MGQNSDTSHLTNGLPVPAPPARPRRCRGLPGGGPVGAYACGAFAIPRHSREWSGTFDGHNSCAGVPDAPKVHFPRQPTATPWGNGPLQGISPVGASQTQPFHLGFPPRCHGLREGCPVGAHPDGGVVSHGVAVGCQGGPVGAHACGGAGPHGVGRLRRTEGACHSPAHGNAVGIPPPTEVAL